MEHEIRLYISHDTHDGIEVSNIGYDMGLDAFCKLQLRKKARMRRWWQGEPVHVGAQRQKPLAQPRALEARVARHEDPFAPVG